MQRDYYLPLKVIRGYLDDLDAGREPVLPGGATVAAPSMLAERPPPHAATSCISEAGATPMLLNDAVSASLIVAADHFGEDTLTVLRALVELQRSGIEPRHLRGFRAAAERELGLIESALIPVARRKDASSRAKAGRDGARDRRSARGGAVEPDPLGARRLSSADEIATRDTPGCHGAVVRDTGTVRPHAGC